MSDDDRIPIKLEVSRELLLNEEMAPDVVAQMIKRRVTRWQIAQGTRKPDGEWIKK